MCRQAQLYSFLLLCLFARWSSNTGVSYTTLIFNCLTGTVAAQNENVMKLHEFNVNSICLRLGMGLIRQTLCFSGRLTFDRSCVDGTMFCLRRLGRSAGNSVLSFHTSVTMTFQLHFSAEYFIEDFMQWTPCRSHRLYWWHSLSSHEWLQWVVSLFWDRVHDFCDVCVILFLIFCEPLWT